jgi:hypothetical protein
MTNDPFDTAKFFDCNESEELSHEEPEEAILELTEYCKLEEIAEEFSEGLTVDAYAPKPLTDADISRHADHLAEITMEWWHDCDSFGSPDGDYAAGELDLVRSELHKALTKALPQFHIWACEQVAKRHYTPEEIYEITKKDRE